VAGCLLLLVGCGRADPPRAAHAIPGGDPDRGHVAFTEYGCTACHTIPGVTGATANVGPPLSNWSVRATVAGTLPNTPENLIRWIMFPQEIDPGNIMPNMGVPELAARDMAAYLYSLRD
jgi:cytochrome c